MSKVINVIYRPHLATFMVSEGVKPRCCCVCDYKVVVQDDNGHMLMASVSDDGDLRDFDADEFVAKYNKDDKCQDMFLPFYLAVDMDNLNEFVEGAMESGEKPVEAMLYVLSDLRESGCSCTDEVKKLLDAMLPENKPTRVGYATDTCQPQN